MEIFIWVLMFFILLVFSVIALVKGIAHRMNEQVNKRFEMLETQVKKLEDDIKNPN